MSVSNELKSVNVRQCIKVETVDQVRDTRYEIRDTNQRSKMKGDKQLEKRGFIR